ncbi:hypothetical protein RJ639_004007 [Escallonia herrerae]|uniref:C3H1-type domain-containing protein n=1 Tax=Escallonia herrerae TaxID=1293975 RepID=A0AA88W231_9ASTE|nr:hypothetical protein RJ639_004007 [Escallonia herrerae]
MSLDLEDCHNDDSTIPLIPITPIEEEQTTENLPPEMAIPVSISVNPQVSDLPPVSLKSPANGNPAVEKVPGIEGDVVAAAAAVLTAILKSNERGSMVDTDLLIQILSDPKMVEKLISGEAAAANTRTEQVSAPKPEAPLARLPSPKSYVTVMKPVNERSAPANTLTSPALKLKTASSLVRMASLKPEMAVKRLANEKRPQASIANTPISRSPSVPLPSSKPDDEKAIKNFIHKHGAHARNGTAHMAGSKPVVQLDHLPSSKPDEYGADDGTEKDFMPVSKVITPLAPSSNPKPEMVVLARPKPVVVPRLKPPLSSPNSEMVVLPMPNPSLSKANTVVMPRPNPPFSSPKPEIVVLPRPKPHVSTSKPDMTVLSMPNPPMSTPKPGMVLVPKPNLPLTTPRPDMLPMPNPPFSVLKSETDVMPTPHPPYPRLKPEICVMPWPNPSFSNPNPEMGVMPRPNPPFSCRKPEMGVMPRPSSPVNMAVFPKPNQPITTPIPRPNPPFPTMLPMPNPPFSTAVPRPNPPFSVAMPRPNLHHISNALQSSLNLKLHSPATVHSCTAPAAPPVKDANYYKNLIKQHGERQETQDHDSSLDAKLCNYLRGSAELAQNLKQSESKPKHQKPCMYFNSTKGCRNGSNCTFQHTSIQQPRPGGELESAPAAKRLKHGVYTSSLPSARIVVENSRNTSVKEFKYGLMQKKYAQLIHASAQPVHPISSALLDMPIPIQCNQNLVTDANQRLPEEVAPGIIRSSNVLAKL